MASDAPRSAAQRKADALALLDTERDVWVATASADGVPALVPLGFWWDGATVTMVAGTLHGDRRESGRRQRHSPRVRDDP